MTVYVPVIKGKSNRVSHHGNRLWTLPACRYNFLPHKPFTHSFSQDETSRFSSTAIWIQQMCCPFTEIIIFTFHTHNASRMVPMPVVAALLCIQGLFLGPLFSATLSLFSADLHIYISSHHHHHPLQTVTEKTLHSAASNPLRCFAIVQFLPEVWAINLRWPHLAQLCSTPLSDAACVCMRVYVCKIHM